MYLQIPLRYSKNTVAELLLFCLLMHYMWYTDMDGKCPYTKSFGVLFFSLKMFTGLVQFAGFS
jgi:hypothetical protein